MTKMTRHHLDLFATCATKKGFNISAVVTESEDPGLALPVLSETFASKKGDLQKAMEHTIKNAIGVNDPNNDPK